MPDRARFHGPDGKTGQFSLSLPLAKTSSPSSSGLGTSRPGWAFSVGSRSQDYSRPAVPRAVRGEKVLGTFLTEAAAAKKLDSDLLQ